MPSKKRNPTFKIFLIFAHRNYLISFLIEKCLYALYSQIFGQASSPPFSCNKLAILIPIISHSLT